MVGVGVERWVLFFSLGSWGGLTSRVVLAVSASAARTAAAGERDNGRVGVGRREICSGDWDCTHHVSRASPG
ncbi:hypothetical protein DFH08DRAFT_866757 [Mycena albidolilacea]|uniref:Uncharacterized protein n=1 Tax=Mycena albidolilacea TaxID=1033008 RepID=A0AAD7A263_9AGAR|nr:hypothetical protein DFH08DRAFT_866757 [Mycena albidolilacea]